jgi:L-cysteine S-thiosulfotransferase
MMRLTQLTLLLAAFAVSAHAGPATEVYREHTTPFAWQPHVSGDKALTNTYQYWKDRKALNSDWAESRENSWKLNWKYMDASVDGNLNGGHVALDRGRTLFEELNQGQAFAACLGAKKGDLKGLRAGYPRFNKALGHVAGLEETIEHCASQHGQTLEHGSYDNSAVSVYIASFSNGLPIKIEVQKQGPLREAYLRGKERFEARVGASNFACASCHVALAGKQLRGQVPTTPYGDATHWPLYRTRGELMALQVRFVECNRNSGVQPLKLNAKAYTDIEVFLTALSNGYAVDVPTARD